LQWVLKRDSKESFREMRLSRRRIHFSAVTSLILERNSKPSQLRAKSNEMGSRGKRRCDVASEHSPRGVCET